MAEARTRHVSTRKIAVAVATAVVVLIGVVGFIRSSRHDNGTPSATRQPSGTHASSATTSGVPARRAGSAPIFAIYYMWWDRSHWTSRLGTSYPLTTSPSPLPATLDANGCGTQNGYAGNKETDISQGLAYDQSNPQVIQNDVNLAAKAGLDGFVVNWIGTGGPQSVLSNDYDKRLSYMFDAVHKLNAAGTHFSLILNYQSSAKKLSPTQFANDLSYFRATYGSDPALDHTYSTRPEVLMAGTWKYSDAEIAAISAQFRPQLYLIGDEKPASWDQARADNLDGTSYYWSSQDPVKNKSSFATLKQFATTVRKTSNPDGKPKTWLAPFTPGYNATLLYDTPTCVPRSGGATMRALFDGNSESSPDGWTLISWNEISEGSYVVPLTRYGMEYVNTLESIVRANH